MKYKVLLFYKFINIANPALLMESQRALCTSLNIRGRILIAKEGVNGTLEGEEGKIEEYKKAMWTTKEFADIKFKESDGDGSAFTKLKVKVRKEVVTLEAGEFDVRKETAQELSADELDALYKNDEDFVVLDLRNDYEVKAGYFDKTFNPELQNFRDLPQNLNKLAHLKEKKVVAVCTGGIRCEKATCLLKREGFENLYQLKDGIHTYMQKYPGKNFKGTLFVFDNRMATDVVEIENKEVVGECIYCGVKCESFYSDDSHKPSRKIICCSDCLEKEGSHLRSCLPN